MYVYMCKFVYQSHRMKLKVIRSIGQMGVSKYTYGFYRATQLC